MEKVRTVALCNAVYTMTNSVIAAFWSTKQQFSDISNGFSERYNQFTLKYLKDQIFAMTELYMV